MALSLMTRVYNSVWPNCAASPAHQICPTQHPDRPMQTPLWIVRKPCVRPHRPHEIIDFPQAALPVTVHGPVAMPSAPGAPSLRARQANGDLPPACRGADCRADQLMDAVRARFHIVHAGLAGKSGMRGKHLLILLPDHDAHALEATRWLLRQHGDFSGKAGKVLLTEQASQWLGGMRGAGRLDTPNSHLFQNALQSYQKLLSELAALVEREKLGAPPLRASGAIALGQQYWLWLEKAGDPALRASLAKYANNLYALHGILGNFSLLRSVTEQSYAQGLTITVLSGTDAHLDSHAFLEAFPGLMLYPAAMPAPSQPATVQRSAGELSATLLREQQLGLRFMDLAGRPIPASTSLEGRLLMLALADEGGLREQAQGKLLSTLVNSPDGKLPVILINMRDTMLTSDHGQVPLYLCDPLAPDLERASQAWRKTLERVQEFLVRHAGYQPQDWNRMQGIGRDEFPAALRKILDGLPAALQTEGQQLLAAYEEDNRGMVSLNLKHWESMFGMVAHAMDKSLQADAIFVMAGPVNAMQTLLGVLVNTPSLMDRLGERVLPAQLHSINPGQARAGADSNRGQ